MKKIAKLCNINSILVYLGIFQQIFVIEIHIWIFIYTNSLFQKNAFDFLLKMGPDLTGLLWYTCHRSIYYTTYYNIQVHGEELWPGREPDNTNLYWTIMHFQVKLATENNGFLGSRPPCSQANFWVGKPTKPTTTTFADMSSPHVLLLLFIIIIFRTCLVHILGLFICQSFSDFQISNSFEKLRSFWIEVILTISL